MTAQLITEGKWQLLISSAAPESGMRAQPVGIEVGGQQVLMAVGSGGSRHLLIPVGDSEEVVQDAGSRGCTVRARALTDGALQEYADMACNRPEVFRVFSLLAEDVLVRLSQHVASPGEVCAACIEDWRELLGGGGFSRNAAVGLFGELWFLRELVRRSPEAVGSWLGPLSAPHDFSRCSCSLEVKTTASSAGMVCQIHGLAQLEGMEGGRHHLGFVRLEERPGGGESIVSLVDSIISLGVRKSELLERLEALSYDAENPKPAAFRQWIVRELRVWEVSLEFPRIVAGSFRNGIPAGVVGISYSIDLSHAGSPLKESEVERLMRILSGEVAIGS